MCVCVSCYTDTSSLVEQLEAAAELQGAAALSELGTRGGRATARERAGAALREQEAANRAKFEAAVAKGNWASQALKPQAQVCTARHSVYTHAGIACSCAFVCVRVSKLLPCLSTGVSCAYMRALHTYLYMCVCVCVRLGFDNRCSQTKRYGRLLHTHMCHLVSRARACVCVCVYHTELNRR